MLTEFDTALVGRSDKLDSWRSAVSTDLVEVDCRVPQSIDFAGAFAVLRCGELGIATLRGSRHMAFRDKSCIKRTGNDFFLLFLQRVGKMLAVVEENSFEILPGDFFFYDASIQHQLIFDEDFDHIVVRIPRNLLKQNWRGLDQRGCFQLTPKYPLVRIAAATLSASASSIRQLGPDDFSIALENALDLFAAAANKTSSFSPSGSGRGSDVTFARARAVIQARLKDADLDPDSIAAALGVSRRSLSKLFQQQGVSIMEYVLLERLEQAARDLSSVSKRGHSVTEIAFRWGFKNASHFSKRFRDHFGVAPCDARDLRSE